MLIKNLLITSFLVLTLFGCRATKDYRDLASDPGSINHDLGWESYSSDLASTKFSIASLINKDNVKDLKLAWKWERSITEFKQEPSVSTKPMRAMIMHNPPVSYNESTPLVIDGRMYLSTPLNRVVSLDPTTGKEFWTYDPKVIESYFGGNDGPVNQGFVQRGLAAHKVDGRLILFLSTNDARVIALDALSGRKITNFGDNAGEINLIKYLNRGEANIRNYGNTSPAIVCNDSLIVGSSILDVPLRIKGRPPGDIHAFDIRTGRLKWRFQTVPQHNQFGVDTWENASWKITGNTNVWTSMSADEDLNQVYLPVSTPSNNFYGGLRHGNNLFADSVVSLDCKTGQRRWHYQLIHHGLWDYDPPAAPILIDAKVNGILRKMLVQVTKQAFAYVFDRTNGQPIWPIVEKTVPPSDTPGEKISLTQPFPAKPLAFDRQGFTEENLIDFTSDLHNQALDVIAKYKYGPLFTPPSIQGTLTLPGLVGGASWAGAAYSPITKKLYVPSITNPALNKLLKEPDLLGSYKYIKNTINRKSPDLLNGLPLLKPPYGRITAIDMQTGNHQWMTPIGRGPIDHPALKTLKIEGDLGWNRRIFVLATPKLVFALQTGKLNAINATKSLNAPIYDVQNSEAFIRALDPDSGKIITEIPIEKNATGSPITYIQNGEQYLVFPTGGGNQAYGFMAYKIQK